MDAPICAVSTTVYLASGKPDLKARITFKLASTDVVAGVGYVLPSEVTAKADPVTGLITANLWRDALGSSYYDVLIEGSERTERTTCTVPNVATTTLEAIAATPASSPKPDGQVAVDLAVAAVAPAAASATAAAGSATAAAGSATAAAGSATAAAGSAGAAAGSAGAAAGSASNAAGSATAAADSATTAAGSATTAGTAAGTATTKAGEAAGSATAAAGSATAAAGSSTTAGTAATTATTKAGEAAGSATGAAGSATAASGSATAAAGSANTASTKAAQATASAVVASDAATAAGGAATAAGNAATTATGAAGTATTQAGIATTAQGIATTKAAEALQSATNAANAENVAVAAAAVVKPQADSVAASMSNALALFGNLAAISAALLIGTGAASTAQAQASLAQSAAAAASSVAQQDLSGTVTAQALHRSPNAVSALFVYDTSKDSDGGAWVERMAWTSWMQEALNGTWLGASGGLLGFVSELAARAAGATTGAEAGPAGAAADFSAGWTPNASASANGGKLTINTTITTGTAATSTTPSVSGTTYLITVVVDAMPAGAGGFSVQVGGVNSASFNAGPGTYTDVVTATGANNFAIISRGGNLPAGTVISKVSIKPVTAFNTKSGDYYQLASDGKFYRLNRNLLSNSDNLGGTAGTIGSGAAAPTGWTIGAAGTLAYPASTRYPGTNNVRFTAAAQSPFSGQNVALSAGLTYVLSFYVEAIASGAVRMVDILGFTGAPAGGSLAWRKNRVAASASGLDAVAAGDFIEAILTLGANGGVTGVRYGLGVSGAITADCTLSPLMVEVSPSSAAIAGTYEYKGLTAGGSVLETFRGNTAKFPKQVAIVAEAANVTLYDLTQPGRPMWMRFIVNPCGTNATLSGAITASSTTGGNISSVAALNGSLLIARNTDQFAVTGVNEVSFTKDRARWFSNYAGQANAGMEIVGPLSQRNVTVPTITVPGYAIANKVVNAVAMTVLPNAPVDPVTGLQVPTIGMAVGSGSAGQVGTVLMNDGTAVNYSQTGLDGVSVSFTKRGEVCWGHNSNYVLVMPLATSNVASIFSATQRNYWPTTPIGVSNTVNKVVVSAGSNLAIFGKTNLSAGETNKLTLIRENPLGTTGPTVQNGLAAQVTGTYSTGWHVGDTRRSLAADTVAGTASGAGLLTGDNSTFTAGIGTWATPFQSTAAATGGQAVVTATGANPYFTQTLAVTPGKAYRLGFDYVAKSAGVTLLALRVGDNTGLASAQLYGPVNQSVGSGQSVDFVANSTGIAFIQFAAAGGVGDTFTLDNVTVKEIVADRSVKAKSSSINGTLAMTAVASAAQLVAYSGFSNDPAQLTELVTNGTFTTDTSGWALTGTGATFVQSGGAGVFTQGSTTSYATQSVATVPGRKYILVWTATSGTASPYVLVGTAANLANLMPADGNAGTRTASFIATTTTSFISLSTNGGTTGQTVTYDNVSVKPADAIGSAANVIQEAYSADLDYGTAQWMAEGWFNVPTTGWAPSNQLTFSQDLSNAAWNKNGLTIGAAVTAPDGTTTAQTVTASAATSLVYRSAVSVNATQVTGSWHWKVGDGQNPWVCLILYDLANSANASLRAWFNLSTGAVGTVTQGGSATNISASTVAAANGFYRLILSGTFPSTASLVFECDQATANGSFVAASTGVNYAWGAQLERGLTVKPYTATTTTAFNGIAPIIDRSGPSGAYWRLGLDGNGSLAYEISDGSSTRRVTSTVAVNDGNAHKVLSTYAGNALTLFLDGAQNVQSTGFFPGSLNNANALLTHGNSFALNAAFPGSIALVRTGATVPFAEQIAYAYAQERAMFQPGAQVALPDTGAVLDLSYDDTLDRVKGVTAANEFSFIGLVRVEAATVVSSGSINKVAMRSGLKLVARTGTNPGVDFEVASINLREALLRRNEEANRLAGLALGRVFDFDATTGQTDFTLPVGWETSEVLSTGASKREGSAKDWIRAFDGFKEATRFNVAPGNGAWVQLIARRAA